MNGEQIKSKSEVAKDHEQQDIDAVRKAVVSEQKEVHLTQTHAIFEMVGELVERRESPVFPKLRFWRASLLVMFFCLVGFMAGAFGGHYVYTHGPSLFGLGPTLGNPLF